MNKKQEVYIGLNSQFSKTTGFSNTYLFQGTREMNALELADKAESVQTWEYGTTDEWIEQAATMLRQQALEIQALHQILGYEGVAVGQDYLDECVADLRKAQE